MPKSPKPLRLRTELWNEAIEMIKAAGFVFADISQDGESVYYRWPDREAQLRISLHRRRYAETLHPNSYRMAATLSFARQPNRSGDPALMAIGDDGLRGMVATVIGRYFLKSKPGPVERP